MKMLPDGNIMLTGTSFMSGPTAIALASYITGVTDYNELLALAEKGDSSKVDLCTSDITAYS